MMTAQEMLDHLKTEPFEPFQIHTASGRTFPIPHPEFVHIGLRTLTVFAPFEGDPEGTGQWEKISLMLIESIAPLESAARKNGR